MKKLGTKNENMILHREFLWNGWKNLQLPIWIQFTRTIAKKFIWHVDLQITAKTS